MTHCEDFIRVWSGFVSPADCQATIAGFEKVVNDPLYKNMLTDNAKQFSNGNLGRKDIAIFLQEPVYEMVDLASKYLYYLQDCVTEYVNEFSQLRGISLSNKCDLKMQRTLPGGGYHVWHYENGDVANYYSRELTWMIYLNDVPEGDGGETEFLYQHRRVRPTQGTVVIWPAGMTHVHRGNPPLSTNKYILTGWYSKPDPEPKTDE